MGGGLMQLVAYGAQDIYLTGNPQITFFKVVYRRHTNFSMEAIEQTFSGSAAYGGKATSTISRNGDLIGRMYVEHSITSTDSGSDTDFATNYGHALLREVELEIGGQRIDKHYGRWMQIWSDLSEFNPTGAAPAHTGGTGKPGQASGCTLFQRMTGTGTGSDGISMNTVATTYTIPLQFYFCRNPGLALPLIALQYHEVKVSIQFEAQASLIRDVGAGADVAGLSPTFKLYVDYIYLDTDERRRFAQQSHEYLIEQVQYQSSSYVTGTDTTKAFDLHFNHPVKELIWQLSTTARETTLAGGVPGDESTHAAGLSLASGALNLKLNGHDRFSTRDIRYFTRAQIWQHHTGFGGTASLDSIGVYSFALKPEEHQPSGTCNFSRIDNARLEVTTALTRTSQAASPGGTAQSTNMNIYAVNYNVLRIMSGMGGLAYSN
jgi:hypothetical protein